MTHLLIKFVCSLTCQQMEHSHHQGGGEAATQAGADSNKATEEDQGQGDQGQQELAPPQVCRQTVNSATAAAQHIHSLTPSCTHWGEALTCL